MNSLVDIVPEFQNLAVVFELEAEVARRQEAIDTQELEMIIAYVGLYQAIAADRPDWYDRAACRDSDNPDAFYIERGKNATEARTTCKTCKVKRQCKNLGVNNKEQFGIWGGITDVQRRAIRNEAKEKKQLKAKRAKR